MDEWMEEHTTSLILANGESVKVFSTTPTEVDFLLAMAARIVRGIYWQGKGLIPDYCPMCLCPSSEHFPRGYEALIIEEFLKRESEYVKQWMADNARTETEIP